MKDGGIKELMLLYLKNFISHMVQMKGLQDVELYGTVHSLYPTWFRWKNGEAIAECLGHTPLYPTWFRWKITSVVDMRPLVGTLYPTWFRWKFSFYYKQKLQNRLYIPHGSDESYRKAENNEGKTQLYIPHGSDES